MKQEIGLFKKNLQLIEKNLWYRQRFDACPHFMFFLGIAHISSIARTKYPFGQRITYAGFSKNRADWYHSLNELQRTAQSIIHSAKRDSKVSEKMIFEFRKWEQLFYQECRNLGQLNLSSLTNTQILAIYHKLENVYINKLNSSPLIDGFALSTDTLIASKIAEFLDRNGLGSKFNAYFSMLTAPVFLSFLQLEEIELIKIAQQIKTRPLQKENLLMQHAKRFFWIHNNYVKDNVLSKSFFEKRLKEYSKIGHKKRIEEIKSMPRENLRTKNTLINQINLPSELRLLLKITDDFNYWQDERKKGTFWATHYFSLLLAEIAKRTSYSIEELKYAMPPEIEDVLKEKISKNELQKRIDYCMFIFTPGRYDVITDKEFIKKLDLIGTGKSTAVKELRGFSASLGKVSGKVKIVESVEEIGKVKQGDILVAVMTRPDYLPAMKKAVAFVTDEGGITCHAAIVAREMKKPCIVGTKIATKILKDGDMVEVNANHGIVKKLK